MRYIITLTLSILIIGSLDAQITLEEFPLESNPVLRKIEADRKVAHQDKLNKLFKPESATERTAAGDCEDDGIYENGETVYVISGDTLELCIDTTGFVTFDNLSVEGNSGTVEFIENCIFYYSEDGLDLGLGDTLIAEVCLPGGDCSLRTFPIVVKRENQSFVETAVSVIAEQDALLCVDPANFILPSPIASSSILDCHSTTLASVSNGNKKDSCALLTANRFAGMDTVCMEISNEFCIVDSYKFPFRVIGDTLDLPFMDEFSYAGPYPNNLWLDRDAYVNNHWGSKPPSVGFATMDGLDSGGENYGGGYGRADFLTSNYLDMSGFNSGSNVYLTCYVQPKGYGYHPNESDSLIIEFKKSTGEWVQIQAFQGMEGDVSVDSLPPFDNFFSFHIISNSYFYNGFQFRFVNYGQRIGIRDIWHIDYVRLTANEIPDGNFEDIAFTNIPNDILDPYSSIPYNHFQNSMLIDSIDIELYSQFDVVETADPSGINIREVTTNTSVYTNPVLLLTDAVTGNVNQRNVPSHEHRFYTNTHPIEGFVSLPAFSEDRLVFETEYYFDVDGENPGLFPQVARNDTVRSYTVFDNYFAYDDGNAETSMRAGDAQGQEVAVKFTATTDDTLRAVQIHFPHYSNQDNARFNLKVYIGELGSIADFENFGVKPFFADAVLDTLQGFTTYRLLDDFGDPAPIAIPAGDFYIGIEQGSNVQLTRIGLDKNTPEAKAFQHLKVGGNWVGLGNNGAMMVRPVVGSFTPPSTPVNELDNELTSIKVFPNPSRGLINIDLGSQSPEEFQVRVYNDLGQLIIDQRIQDGNVDLSAFDAGVYYVQINNLKTNQFTTRKVFILANK